MDANPDTPFYELDDDDAYACDDHVMEWVYIGDDQGVPQHRLQCRTCCGPE